MEKELVEKYRELRATKKRLEDQLSVCNEQVDEAEKKLVDHLNDNDKKRTATYEGLGFVSLVKPALYVSCPEENKPLLFDYLKEHDASDLVKPTVHNGSLRFFIAREIEEGREVPKFINYFTKQKVKLYKGG